MPSAHHRAGQRSPVAESVIEPASVAAPLPPRPLRALDIERFRDLAVRRFAPW